jgi:predicted transcriptional regulator
MTSDSPKVANPFLSTLGHHWLVWGLGGQLSHLEAAGSVGSACRVCGMQPGTGQAARPRWPILPFEVEEDTGMRLCWSHSCFH